jgi:hypothetical protein
MGKDKIYYSEKQNVRQIRSDKKNCKVYAIKLTRSTDADIIEKLDSVENRQGYIKELIRRDLEENKEKS